jgi:hypothetical protein
MSGFIELNNHLIHTTYKNILKQYNEFQKKMDIYNLFDILYSLNHIYSYIGLLRLIGRDVNAIEGQIEVLYNEIFTNTNILEFLKSIKKQLRDIEEKNYVKKLIRKISERKDTFKKYRSQIETILNKPMKVKLPDEFKEEIPTLPNEILLSRNYYFALQKTIKNPSLRKTLEGIYYEKVNQCLDTFNSLVIERYNFAKSQKYKSFLHLKRTQIYEKINVINFYIMDLNEKINKRFEIEVNRIRRLLKKDGFNKKVDISDIIYYKDKLESKIYFEPSKVIDTIFNLIYGLFKIKFINYENSNSPLIWGNNISIYKMTDEKNEIEGYLYIDFNSKMPPLCINIMHRYIQKRTNVTLPPQVAILCNFTLGKKCMKFADIIALAREFGTAIRYLTSQSTIGNIIYDNEFNNLVPNILEYTVWDNIQKFDKTLDSSSIEKIQFTRYIDFAYSIKIRCINALFDHIIHNSDEIITFIKKENNMQQIYKNIFKQVISIKNFNTDISGISPTLLLQEVNGNESLLYENIFCEIITYAIYSEIQSGKNFLEDVLKNNIDPINNLVHEFLKGHTEHSYFEYLDRVINYMEINTTEAI